MAVLESLSRPIAGRHLRPLHVALVASLVLLVPLTAIAIRRFVPWEGVVRSQVQSVSAYRPVMYADDAGKPGALRSVLGQQRFHQEPRTSGPSPDVLRFTFDRPARILGVDVSVDIDGMDLVEVAVGIDAPNYGSTARDWLLHTSDQNGGNPSKIDEHIRLPDGGFAVTSADSVDVVAWLFNSQEVPIWVSPEVIVYYAWTDGAAAQAD